MKLFTFKKSLFLLSIVLSFSLNIFSQNKIEPNCGTVTSSKFIEHLKNLKPQLKSFEEDFVQMKSGKTKNSKKVSNTIPIKIHIIRNSDASGGLELDNLDSVLSNLNDIYRDALMEFSIYQNIDYIDNDQLCHFKKDNESAFIKSNYTPGLINVYFTNYIENASDESICGYSDVDDENNIIVIKNSCATNNSSLAHEFGHFFSLMHTHGNNSLIKTDELVDGSNCDTNGDGICDTPADPGLSSNNIDNFCSYIGNEKDANGEVYNPDTENIMSYSRKACRNHFSEQQLARMYAYYKTIEKKISDPLNYKESKDEPGLLVDLKIYPNPVTSGKINLNISKIDTSTSYQIANYQGQILLKGIVSNGEVNVNHLSSGSYLLILENSNSRIVKKFIK